MAHQPDSDTMTEDELYDLAVPIQEDPEWAVVMLDQTASNAIDLKADTRSDAQLLADALNNGRCGGRPEQHYYVPVPMERVSDIQSVQ